MANRVEFSEYVERAEQLAAENGGFLPTMTDLDDMGEIRVVRAIRLDRAPFEHLLPKMGRGRDKAKYAYVKAHMDEHEDDLAAELGVSKTTVRNWKAEIRESELGIVDVDDAPDDASVPELARFIIGNLPKDWTLDMTFGGGGCYVTLVQPNGMRRGVGEAQDKSIVESVVTHVNHARIKSGLEPVGWSD
jgi:hypothetical protein